MSMAKINQLCLTIKPQLYRVKNLSKACKYHPSVIALFNVINFASYNATTDYL
jgi:hypothetical protein